MPHFTGTVLDETFYITEDRFAEHAVVKLRPDGATQGGRGEKEE